MATQADTRMLEIWETMLAESEVGVESGSKPWSVGIGSDIVIKHAGRDWNFHVYANASELYIELAHPLDDFSPDDWENEEMIAAAYTDYGFEGCGDYGIAGFAALAAIAPEFAENSFGPYMMDELEVLSIPNPARDLIELARRVVTDCKIGPVDG